MYWGHNMMGWGGGWGGGIGMILFWILLIVVVVVLVKYLMPKTNERAEHAEHKETPMEILKRRYANGEIDKAEYEEKKKDLQ